MNTHDTVLIFIFTNATRAWALGSQNKIKYPSVIPSRANASMSGNNRPELDKTSLAIHTRCKSLPQPPPDCGRQTQNRSLRMAFGSWKFLFTCPYLDNRIHVWTTADFLVNYMICKSLEIKQEFPKEWTWKCNMANRCRTQHVITGWMTVKQLAMLLTLVPGWGGFSGTGVPWPSLCFSRAP